MGVSGSELDTQERLYQVVIHHVCHIDKRLYNLKTILMQKGVFLH